MVLMQSILGLTISYPSELKDLRYKMASYPQMFGRSDLVQSFTTEGRRAAIPPGHILALFKVSLSPSLLGGIHILKR